MKRHRGMRPQDTFSTAWQITWDNKTLWVFGFFAALTLGDNRSSFVQGSSWLFQNIGSLLGSSIVVTWLTILSAVIFWVLGIVARISLIREVAALDVRKPRPVSPIKESFTSSARFLARVMHMQLLVLSPILIFSLIVYFLTKPLSNGFQNIVSQSNFAVIFTSMFLGSGMGILITILCTTIDAFSFRGIVLEGLDVKNSIRNAIQIIKSNLKFILRLGLICAVIGGILSFILLAAISPIFLAMIRPLSQTVSACTVYQGNAQAMADCLQQFSANPIIVTINIIVGIVGGLLFSIWTTLRSASFTIAHIKFIEGKKTSNIS